MAVQLLFCWVLLPRYVQNRMLHSCVIPILCFFLIIKVQMVQPYNSTDTDIARKNFHFILLHAGVYL